MTALYVVSGFLMGVATTAALLTPNSEWILLFIPAFICLAVGVSLTQQYNKD